MFCKRNFASSNCYLKTYRLVNQWLNALDTILQTIYDMGIVSGRSQSPMVTITLIVVHCGKNSKATTDRLVSRSIKNLVKNFETKPDEHVFGFDYFAKI